LAKGDSRQVETRMFPVSVKGVVVQGGKVLLLRNERDEWELPGGKLEVGEDGRSSATSTGRLACSPRERSWGW
jgi:ADP-ribose pyrophosphatase YjhB (NUDIX family)